MGRGGSHWYCTLFSSSAKRLSIVTSFSPSSKWYSAAVFRFAENTGQDTARIWTLEAETCNFKIYRLWHNTSFFLGQCTTYCSLTLGSATLGQYLDLKPTASETKRNSKKNYVLSQIWQNCKQPFCCTGLDILLKVFIEWRCRKGA